MTKSEFLDSVVTIAESVWEFHERWGFEGASNKVLRDPQEVFEKERHAILDEEIHEFKDALAHRRLDQAQYELADVLFVALGHCKAYDRDICFALREIAKRNNEKTEKTHAIRSDTGKLISLSKPEKWVGAEDEHYYHLMKSMEIK